MSIKTAVTRKLDNNYVQVEIKSGNENRYYKVPEDKADTFQRQYVANSKKIYWLSSLLTFCAGFGAAGLGFIFTKHMDSKIAKYGISGGAGLLSGAIATVAYNNKAVKEHKNFLKEFSATEIDYDKPNLFK